MTRPRLTYQSRGSFHRHPDIASLLDCDTCALAASYTLDQGLDLLTATAGPCARSLTDDELAEVRVLLTRGAAA